MTPVRPCFGGLWNVPKRGEKAEDTNWASGDWTETTLRRQRRGGVVE